MSIATSSQAWLLALICLSAPGQALALPFGDQCGEILHKLIAQNPRVDASRINPNQFVIGNGSSGISRDSEGVAIHVRWAGTQTWTECFLGLGSSRAMKCGDLFLIGSGPDPNDPESVRLISKVNQQEAWARSLNERITDCRLTDKDEGIPQYETALHLYDMSTGHRMGRRFPMKYGWTAQYKIDGMEKVFDLRLTYDGLTRWFPDRPIF